MTAVLESGQEEVGDARPWHPEFRAMCGDGGDAGDDGGGGLAGAAHAQTGPAFGIVGANVQKQANAVLTLMSFAVVPDLASSSLSISNTSTDNPALTLWQLGGGFTLEPVVSALSGGVDRLQPLRPDLRGLQRPGDPQAAGQVEYLRGHGGRRLGFPLIDSKELVFRPIFNASLGRVASDLSVAKFAVEHVTDQEIAFLDNGAIERLRAGRVRDAGLGKPPQRARCGRGTALHQHLPAQLWHHGRHGCLRPPPRPPASTPRWRAPTGLRALDRPVRYVLELSHSHYFGNQAGAWASTT